jgi:hypothetical protein
MATRKLPILPKNPVSPYIRPKRAKAMTIGVGFNCGASLVLGADRQVSSAGFNKFFEQKLFVDVKPERVLALVGADDLSLAKEVWDKLLRYPVVTDIEAVRTALEATLNDLGRLYTSLPLQLLLGVAVKGKVELFSFTNRGIQTNPGFNVIGIADCSLMRYFGEHLHDIFSSDDDTAVIAYFMLKKAEAHVDGCAGPMDLVVLTTEPSLKRPNNAWCAKVEELTKEKETAFFNQLFSIYLPFSK